MQERAYMANLASGPYYIWPMVSDEPAYLAHLIYLAPRFQECASGEPQAPGRCVSDGDKERPAHQIEQSLGITYTHMCKKEKEISGPY
jgi:hypothetical protein